MVSNKAKREREESGGSTGGRGGPPIREQRQFERDNSKAFLLYNSFMSENIGLTRCYCRESQVMLLRNLNTMIGMAAEIRANPCRVG